MLELTVLQDHDVEYKKTNRQKAMAPKFSAGWCGKCDANRLTGYEKCPYCGARNREFRLKKEPIC